MSALEKNKGEGEIRSPGRESGIGVPLKRVIRKELAGRFHLSKDLKIMG